MLQRLDWFGFGLGSCLIHLTFNYWLKNSLLTHTLLVSVTWASHLSSPSRSRSTYLTWTALNTFNRGSVFSSAFITKDWFAVVYFTVVAFGELCTSCRICSVSNYSSWTKAGVHNLWEMCYILPSQQVKKYKKLLVNDGNFKNEFKLHWTINNFAIYYNPKQLCWQQYQTTSNKTAS